MSILFTLWGEGLVGNEARGGGVISGGGGGNSKKEEQSFREFEAAFLQIVRYLPQIFHRLAGKNHPIFHDFMENSVDSELPPALLAKLHGGKNGLPPLEAHLRSIDFQLQRQGPCKNSEGEEFDGSASTEANSVCVSYERLRNELSNFDLWPRLAGLLVHEVSHLRGTRHLGGREIDEAEFLQAQAEKFVTWHYPGQLSSLRKKLAAQLALEVGLLSNLHLELESIAPRDGQDEKLKHAYLELTRWINTSKVEVNKNLDLLSYRELNLYLALSEQIAALSMYFEADPMLRRTRHEVFFGTGEEAISLRSYLRDQKKKCDPICETLSESEMIYRNSYGDSAAFKAQFAEILRVIKALHKSIAVESGGAAFSF